MPDGQNELTVDQKEDIHQHSGWLIPAVFLFAILLLSGLFLGWYLRPGPGFRLPPPTSPPWSTLTVRGQAFTVPANYIQNSAARARRRAEKRRHWRPCFPSWRAIPTPRRGCSPATRRIPRWCGLSLHGDTNPLDAAARLARIYQPYIPDPQGTAGPFGLTQYGFRTNSGYGREDLFAGEKAAS